MTSILPAQAVTTPPMHNTASSSTVSVTPTVLTAEGTPYVTQFYHYAHPSAEIQSAFPEKEMLLTRLQALEKNKKLPKGYRLVPVDVAHPMYSTFVGAHAHAQDDDMSTADTASVGSGMPYGSGSVVTTSRSNRNVKAPGKKYGDENITLDETMRKCFHLLTTVMGQRGMEVFNEPVDPIKHGAPTYYDIIKSPMDLGTIKTKVSTGQISDIQEFATDVRLTFENAMIFNPKDNWIHALAEKTLHFFNDKFAGIEDYTQNLLAKGGKKGKSSSSKSGNRKRDRDDDDDYYEGGYSKRSRDDYDDGSNMMQQMMGMFNTNNNSNNKNNMMNPMMQMMMMASMNPNMMQQMMGNMMGGNAPASNSGGNKAPPRKSQPTTRPVAAPAPPPRSAPPPVAATTPMPQSAMSRRTSNLPTKPPVARVESGHPSNDEIEALQTQVQTLEYDQMNRFINLISELDPSINPINNNSDEISIDFTKIDIRSFRQLEQYVREQCESNMRKQAQNRPSILTSPGVADLPSRYSHFSPSAATPLGPSGGLMSDTESESGSDSDDD